MRTFKLPNTFVLLCAILAMIALATWLVPGGKFDTQLVNGKQLIIPGTFHYVANKPQGLAALMMAPTGRRLPPPPSSTRARAPCTTCSTPAAP